MGKPNRDALGLTPTDHVGKTFTKEELLETFGVVHTGKRGRPSYAVPEGTRWCPACGVLKWHHEYSPGGDRGKTRYCKDCKAARRPRSSPRLGKPGHVYVVINPVFREVKIGAAQDVAARVRAMQTQDPHRRFEAFWSVPCPDYYRAEGVAHKLFDKYRIGRTEWFDVDPYLAARILNKIDFGEVDDQPT